MRKNREGEYTVEREFLGQIPWEEAVFSGAPGSIAAKTRGESGRGERRLKAGDFGDKFPAAGYIRLSREDGDREESDSVMNQKKTDPKLPGFQRRSGIGRVLCGRRIYRHKF